MTTLQRLKPTDPSRSVDFDVHGDAGRGAAGGGSNRTALLEAAQRGQLPAALPAAPHHVAGDGSVKIPPKWCVASHTTTIALQDEHACGQQDEHDGA